MLPFDITPWMAGHPLVLKKYFHRRSRQADIYLLFDQVIRNAVMMVINGNMVINIDSVFLP
jgi:hypothetical protein